MARRQFLSQLLGLPFLALGTKPQESKKTLKIMMRSSWGTDDPTRASFVFAHALALAEAGHEVQIFLTADATYLMRKATSDRSSAGSDASNEAACAGSRCDRISAMV